jgi:Zn-dependent peptidase ImmA (M78 family)
MENEIESEISKTFRVSPECIHQFNQIYRDTIRPKIKERFLSHLIATIEDLINDKKMKEIINTIRNPSADTEKTIQLFQSKNLRLYSILLMPVNIKRRATTRYHNNGATIYYNAVYEAKQIRILIAHELGHIINKEFIVMKDNENTANLFAYIAMKDKNDFYSNECKNFVFRSDLTILHEIENMCPLINENFE